MPIRYLSIELRPEKSLAFPGREYRTVSIKVQVDGREFSVTKAMPDDALRSDLERLLDFASEEIIRMARQDTAIAAQLEQSGAFSDFLDNFARHCGAPRAVFVGQLTVSVNRAVAEATGPLQAEIDRLRAASASAPLNGRLLEIAQAIGELLPVGVQHRGPIDALKWFAAEVERLHLVNNADLDILAKEVERGDRLAAENAALKAAPASLRKLLEDLRDNCGCCEDVEPCANCRRIDAALAAPVSAWTTEPPKVEGDWWWRDLSTGHKHRMVYVFADQTLTSDPRLFTGDPRTLQQQIVTASQIGGEWQGPIEPK